MWNENTIQELHTNHGRGGVAPSRHELAREIYTEKVRARHETERHAATIGAMTIAISRLWALTRAMFAGTQSTEPPARRTAGEFPAE